MPANSRIKELDVFRGLAAIAVVLYHFTFNFNITFPASTYHAPVVLNHGNLGVELFFIISGFVIYLTIADNPEPIHFAISRFSKLYPAYWFSVLLAACLPLILHISQLETPLKDFLWNLTMLQSFPKIHAQQVQQIYWTLGAELCFYLYVIISLITGLYRWPVLVIQFSMATMIIINYYYLHYGLPWYQPVYQYLFLFNSLPLFCHGILFYLLRKGENKIYIYANMALCMFAYFMVKDAASITAVALFTGMFLLFVHGYLQWIVHPVTVFSGEISYSLYLVHQNSGYIILLKLCRLGINSSVALIITLSAVVVMAALVTWFIEKPAMRMIRGKFRN